MRRTIFNLTAAISMVLALASIVLCVRSYSRSDEFGHDWGDLASELTFSRGYIGLELYDNLGNSPRPWETFDSILKPVTPDSFIKEFEPQEYAFTALGFAYGAFDSGTIHWRRWVLFVPMWFPALAFGLAPAIWCARRNRRRNGTEPGLCPTCAYDLRASKDRCPECGTAIPASNESGTQ
jgi:hypothetical protein